MATDCNKCKCWIRPFEPPEGCYNCCAGRILKFAKTNELVNIFKIPEPIAENIFEISADEKNSRLSDFRSYLSQEDFEIVDAALRNISEAGWFWIQKNFFLPITEEQQQYTHV